MKDALEVITSTLRGKITSYEDKSVSVARFVDLSTIYGFLEQKIVCGWIKAKSRVFVNFSAYC